MQKVISINLNGHAYQVDEAGYDALVDLVRVPVQIDADDFVHGYRPTCATVALMRFQ